MKWKQILITLTPFVVLFHSKSHLECIEILFVDLREKFQACGGQHLNGYTWTLIGFIGLTIAGTIGYFWVHTSILFGLVEIVRSMGEESPPWQGRIVYSPYVGHFVLVHLVILLSVLVWNFNKLIHGFKVMKNLKRD